MKSNIVKRYIIFAMVVNLFISLFCLLACIKVDKAYAYNITDEIGFLSGASVRLDVAEDNNTSGIRFRATISDNLYTDLVSDGALKAGAEVGMIIVPEVAYYQAFASSEASDFFAWAKSEKNKEKEDISVSFGIDKIIADVTYDYIVNGVLAGIKDENYNLEYRAIAYYTLDGGATYYYCVNDDDNVRSLSDVVYSALEDNEADYSDDQIEVLAGMAKKAICAENDISSLTNLALTVNASEDADISDIWSNVPADAEFSVADGDIAYVDENGVITGINAGTTTLTVNAFYKDETPVVSFDVALTVTNTEASYVTRFDKEFAEESVIAHSGHGVVSASQENTYGSEEYSLKFVLWNFYSTIELTKPYITDISDYKYLYFYVYTESTGGLLTGINGAADVKGAELKTGEWTLYYVEKVGNEWKTMGTGGFIDENSSIKSDTDITGLNITFYLPNRESDPASYTVYVSAIRVANELPE